MLYKMWSRALGHRGPPGCRGSLCPPPVELQLTNQWTQTKLLSARGFSPPCSDYLCLKVVSFTPKQHLGTLTELCVNFGRSSVVLYCGRWCCAALVPCFQPKSMLAPGVMEDLFMNFQNLKSCLQALISAKNVQSGFVL